MHYSIPDVYSRKVLYRLCRLYFGHRSCLSLRSLYLDENFPLRRRLCFANQNSQVLKVRLRLLLIAIFLNSCILARLFPKFPQLPHRRRQKNLLRLGFCISSSVAIPPLGPWALFLVFVLGSLGLLPGDFFLEMT